MDYDILAKFLGYVFVVISLSFLCNKKKFNHLLQIIEQEPGIQFLMGFITVLIGSLLIANYNRWDWSLDVSVTLMGWLIFISGIFRLCFTKQWVSIIRNQNSSSLFFMNLITLLLGLFFLYLGYFYHHY